MRARLEKTGLSWKLNETGRKDRRGRSDFLNTPSRGKERLVLLAHSHLLPRKLRLSRDNCIHLASSMHLCVLHKSGSSPDIASRVSKSRKDRCLVLLTDSCVGTNLRLVVVSYAEIAT